MSSKYTRRKVRRAIPEAYGSIVDELLHAVGDGRGLVLRRELRQALVLAREALNPLVQAIEIPSLGIVSLGAEFGHLVPYLQFFLLSVAICQVKTV